MSDQMQTSRLAYDAPARVQATTAPPGKLAYTVPELVAATGVGRTTLYEEMKAGRLRTCKVGKRTLVTAEDARAWLSTLRDSSQAA